MPLAAVLHCWVANSLCVIRLCCHCSVPMSVYSAPDHMVNASKSICGIYVGIFPHWSHQVIFACCFYMAFEQHICCCHIFCSGLLQLITFGCMWSVMWGIYVCYSRRVVWHICNVAVIFVQGYMPRMWNLCKPVPSVTLLVTLSSCELYIMT